MTARRWMSSRARLLSVMAMVAGCIVVYLWVLPVVLADLIGTAFALKLICSGLLIAPPAFAMGMPFPGGLRALAARAAAQQSDSAIEWAWAMNAAASVLGSVMAIIIAIHFGLNVTLACGAVSYGAAILLAAFALPKLQKSS